MTFLDTGNPYVTPLTRCRFAHEGKTIDVTLDWRAPQENLYERHVFGTRPKAGFSWTRLENGMRWIAIPSFDGNSESPAGKKLTELVSYLAAHGDEVRASPAVVFDLRGNGGGSSDWSRQIAMHFWGEGAIARRPESPMTISWRASRDNLEALRATFAERSKGGNLSADASDWFRDTIAGLEKAVAAGDALWVVEPEPVEARELEMVRDLPVYPLRGPVYVVVDSSCMSACLDAVDLWTRLGTIPIGRETGADTLYMETRQVRLPSGLGGVSLPMKVYSGRARGSNEPIVPRHRFDGDMSDTTALQAWVATLAE